MHCGSRQLFHPCSPLCLMTTREDEKWKDPPKGVNLFTQPEAEAGRDGRRGVGERGCEKHKSFYTRALNIVYKD